MLASDFSVYLFYATTVVILLTNFPFPLLYVPVLSFLFWHFSITFRFAHLCISDPQSLSLFALMVNVQIAGI